MAFGSFDSSRGAQPMSEINMVPLIDVMLVLLVIFIITAPLLTHAIKVDLPQATATPNDLQPERIEFSIDAQGQHFWGEERISREEAQRRFLAQAARQPQPELHLRADARTPYEVVAQVLADAQRAGLGKIGFVSLEESAQP